MTKCVIHVVALLSLMLAGGRAEAQLLLNAGFETFSTNAGQVVASNWTQQAAGGASMSGAQETTNPHSGTACQRVVASGQNQTNVAVFYQPFQLQPGHVDSAGVWLRAATNSLLQFELQDADNHFQAAASCVVTIGTNWQQVLITGGWQSGANARFTVNFLSNGTNWIDDASLADVTSNYLYAPLINPTSTIPTTLFGMHIIKLASAPNDWSPLPQGVIRFWDTNVRWNQLQTNSNTWTCPVFSERAKSSEKCATVPPASSRTGSGFRICAGAGKALLVLTVSWVRIPLAG